MPERIYRDAVHNIIRLTTGTPEGNLIGRLIEVLRGLNEGRDYNGIPLGRPTGFVIGARVNPSADDISREAASARRKIAAGATFFVTPPAYDLIAFERLLDAVAAPNIPVLLGVMALQNLRHAEYLQHEVPEMSVPASVLERMSQAGERAREAKNRPTSSMALAMPSGWRWSTHSRLADHPPNVRLPEPIVTWVSSSASSTISLGWNAPFATTTGWTAYSCPIWTAPRSRRAMRYPSGSVRMVISATP